MTASMLALPIMQKFSNMSLTYTPVLTVFIQKVLGASPRTFIFVFNIWEEFAAMSQV